MPLAMHPATRWRRDRGGDACRVRRTVGARDGAGELQGRIFRVSGAPGTHIRRDIATPPGS